MQTELNKTKQEMGDSITLLKNELAKVRTGRASIALLDQVRVDYYGSKVPLNQVATLNVPDPRTITIQPWEQGIIQDVEKAIHAADIGVNPVDDGKVIRINIPPLNEERRKELVKVIKKLGEEAKVRVRNVRRNAIDVFKKKESSKEITEDDLHRGQDEAQKLTDQFVAQIDELIDHKEKDILSI